MVRAFILNFGFWQEERSGTGGRDNSSGYATASQRKGTKTGSEQVVAKRWWKSTEATEQGK